MKYNQDKAKDLQNSTFWGGNTFRKVGCSRNGSK